MKSGLWIFIAVWQVLVLMALASGVMVDLFDLFQVPWNSTGWRNFLGTSAGLLLLELPAPPSPHSHTRFSKKLQKPALSVSKLIWRDARNAGGAGSSRQSTSTAQPPIVHGHPSLRFC